jgi:hypothetical protein
MAKTEAQFAKELEDSIIASDPTIDVSQGAVPDTMIRPQAGRFAEVAATAESMRKLFTLDFDDSITDDELRKALANFGSSPGSGTNTRHTQHFMRFTRPTHDIVIPVGTLVSSNDGQFVYRTVVEGRIPLSSANTFYNPSRRAYEIGIVAEATGVGPEYKLPRGRINTLVTSVRGIDSTENRTTPLTGGLPVEDKTSQVSRLIRAFSGTNLGGPGGIKSSILNSLPELATDVAVVQATDKEFTRVVAGPALDLYVIGSSSDTATARIVATGGQTIIPLEQKPALSVTSLTVNGVSNAIDFSLVKDMAVETRDSLSANDVVVLSTPLLAGDVVVVEYTYNSVLQQAKDVVFGGGDSFLFNTDILLRSPWTVNPRIIGEIRALPSYSVTEIETQVHAFLAEIFNFTQYTELVYPEVIRQRVATELAGIQSFRLTGFRRAVGSLAEVEIMAFAKNEVSVYDEDLVEIKVVT